MSVVLESHKQNIGRLRVFSLTMALILITFALAGVTFDTPAKVQPLGIPLVITRPELLTIALVFASAFSALRFLYFAMLVQPSPIRARRRLLLGSRVDTGTAPANLDEFHKQVSAEIHRYFPRVGKHRVRFEISQSAEGYGLKVTVPPLLRWVAKFEDLDFLAPIWANLIALTLWFCAIIQ